MFNTLATQEQLQKTTEALKARGFDAVIVETGEDAKNMVLDMIPSGAEVMTMTSITLESIGVVSSIESGEKHKAARHVLTNAESTDLDKKRVGHLSEWTIGSVHAITEDGQVVIASSTGSQLPSYAYSSDHVIWVVGGQKIVKDLEMAMVRLEEHTIPLETVRARKAYGLPDTFSSAANKLLIVNREVKPGRITILLVKEVLGY